MSLEKGYKSVYSRRPREDKRLGKAFTVILSECGIEPEEDFLERLSKEFVNISSRYIANLHIIEHRPRVSAQKKELIKFIKATKRYLKIVEDLDEVAMEKIHHIGNIRVGSKKIYKLANDLIFFQNIAEEALQEAQTFIDPGGEKKKIADRVYIGELIDIYMKIQKDDKKLAVYSDPYGVSCKGALFNFVRSCLMHIGYPPDSDGGLGERIKEVKRIFPSIHP